LAKTTKPCVKFLRERPVSRKVRIQRAVFHAANRGAIVGDNFAWNTGEPTRSRAHISAPWVS